MSEYISIYVKNKETFTELFCMGRCSGIYMYLNAPYGCVTELTDNKIEEAISEVEKAIKGQESLLKAEEEKLKLFGDTKPSYEEWREAYYDKREFDKEIKETIEEFNETLAQLKVLKLITNNYMYCPHEYSLWYGVEVPEDENGNPKEVWDRKIKDDCHDYEKLEGGQ